MSSSNTQIRASHILLKAMRIDVLSGKTNFNNIASRYSHCSSAKRGGNLGCFGHGKMHKSFGKVAFALNVDEISDVVETESGVHIIKRTQ